MTNAEKRAAKKTAITVALIALMIGLCFIWPPLAGYFILGFFILVIVFMIYASFGMWEETKEWRKRD
jgi:hypothetical protein